MIAARLAGVVAILFVISIITFALLYFAPGDLVKNLIGTRPVNAETIVAIRDRYNLDDPVVVQYLTWLGNALRGDFGESIRMQEPVSLVVGQRIGLTAVLCGLSFLIAIAVSIPLGVASAVRRGSVVDKAATSATLVGLSAPSFVVGLILLYAFAYYLPIFPVYGSGDGLLDMLYHLILPAIALAASLGALLMRLTRAAMVRELASDYVTSLRSRGVRSREVNRIALRNATIPIMTGGGLVLTFLVSGTILVEAVFSLPGIGTLLQDAVLYKDIPVVQAVTLLLALVIAVIALVVDFSYLAADPRVRARFVGGRP